MTVPYNSISSKEIQDTGLPERPWDFPWDLLKQMQKNSDRVAQALWENTSPNTWSQYRIVYSDQSLEGVLQNTYSWYSVQEIRKELWGDPVKEKNFIYIVSRMKQSEKWKDEYSSNPQRAHFSKVIELINEINDEKHIYILWLLAEGGLLNNHIDITYIKEILTEITNIEILNDAISMVWKTNLWKIQNAYRLLNTFGKEFLVTIQKAKNITDTLNNDKRMSKYVYIPLWKLDIQDYVEGDAFIWWYFIRHTANLDISNMDTIYELLGTCKSLNIDTVMSFQDFIFLVEFIHQKGDMINISAITKEWIHENWLENKPIQDILLCLAYPSTEHNKWTKEDYWRDKRNQKNTLEKAWRMYWEEQKNSFSSTVLKDLWEDINVLDYDSNIIARTNTKILPNLEYLDKNMGMWEFIQKYFKISNLNQLSESIQYINNNKSKPNFRNRISALSGLFHELNQSKIIPSLWHFFDAYEVGFIHFLWELYKKTWFNILDNFQYGYEWFKLKSIMSWYKDREGFLQAVKLGFFRESDDDKSGEYTSNIYHYATMKLIMKKMNLSNFNGSIQDVREVFRKLWDTADFFIEKCRGDTDTLMRLRQSIFWDDVLHVLKKKKTHTVDYIEFLSSLPMRSSYKGVKSDLAILLLDYDLHEAESVLQDIEYIDWKTWWLLSGVDIFRRILQKIHNKDSWYKASYVNIFVRMVNLRSQEMQALKYQIASMLLDYDISEAENVLQDIEYIDWKIWWLLSGVDILKRILQKIHNKDSWYKESYVNIFVRVLNSRSQEMQKLKYEITSMVSDYDIDEAHKIVSNMEDIFLQNHLPLVGKVYKVFDLIHNNKTLQWKLMQNHVSPFLRKRIRHTQSEAGRNILLSIFYSDILKSFAFSNNRDLKWFIQKLEEGEWLLNRYESWESLSPVEQRKFHIFLKELSVLYENRIWSNLNWASIGNDLWDLYQLTKTILWIQNGESISRKIAQDFLKPLQVSSFSELREKIQKKVKEANMRGRWFANNDLNFENWDYLKWIDSTYFSNILQNWVNAREFLWASHGSDLTPLDTDLAVIHTAEWKTTTEILSTSMSQGYGVIKLVFKKKIFWEKSIDTSALWENAYDREKYELFRTWVLGHEHYWVRTGIASTDIDAIIFQFDNERQKEEYFINIAQNGFYIPVYNSDGKLIFTPEQFEEYRKVFRWISRFDGDALELLPINQDDIRSEKYRTLGKDIESSINRMQSYISTGNNTLETTIKKFLTESGIMVKEEWDRWLLWAEVVNSGSTGRWTSMINVPWEKKLFDDSSLDIDLIVHLDDNDIPKIHEIVGKLHKELGTLDSEWSGPRAGNAYQFKSNTNKLWHWIDILFTTKNQLREYDTWEALKDRYEYIKSVYGEKRLNEIKWQIILAKKILKDAWIYKKLDGWLWGVGVENWILSRGGSVVEAFRSFIEISEKVWNNLDEFRKLYPIIDPWLNIIPHAWVESRDNYTHKLSQGVYEKMRVIWKEIIW